MQPGSIATPSLVALALLAPEAYAEQQRGGVAHIESGARPSASLSAAARPIESVDIDLSKELRRDVARLSSVFNGSPVVRRAQARTRHRRAKALDRPSLQRSLEVFRKSQHGPFDEAIAEQAEHWGLDPFLFKGLLINESRLNPKLTGKRLYEGRGGRRRAVGGGARGIAQFTSNGVAAVNEARQRRYYRGERVEAFRRKDVWDTDKAIAAAAELLASYIDRFGRDGGVTAYNSGPYGGRLVAKHGFYRARSTGKLSRIGRTRLQGHRFLLNVLRQADRLRQGAGLAPLAKPDQDRRRERQRRSRRRRAQRSSS